MTKREMKLVVVTAALMCIPIAIIAAYHIEKPFMSSSVFEWKQMKVNKTAVGAVRPVFDARTATLTNLECHITTLKPGEMAHAAHQHPDEEILIIKEGNVECLVNGEMKRVGQGSIVFQASNISHSIRNVGTAPCTYYVVKFDTKGDKK